MSAANTMVNSILALDIILALVLVIPVWKQNSAVGRVLEKDA